MNVITQEMILMINLLSHLYNGNYNLITRGNPSNRFKAGMYCTETV